MSQHQTIYFVEMCPKRAVLKGAVRALLSYTKQKKPCKLLLQKRLSNCVALHNQANLPRSCFLNLSAHRSEFFQVVFKFRQMR